VGFDSGFSLGPSGSWDEYLTPDFVQEGYMALTDMIVRQTKVTGKDYTLHNFDGLS